MYKISVPVRVRVTKKKWFVLNLNQYRNAHFFALSKAKKDIAEIVVKQIKNIPLLKHVFIVYIIYPRTKHKTDIMNVSSIADKFMCDALTKNKENPKEHYIIEDDNSSIVCGTVSFFGSVDKDNPRIDAYIIPLENEMKIQLNSDDIQSAVLTFLSDLMGFQVDGKLEFNDEGISVEFDHPKQNKAAKVPSTSQKVEPEEDKESGLDISAQQENDDDEESKSLFG